MARVLQYPTRIHSVFFYTESGCTENLQTIHPRHIGLLNVILTNLECFSQYNLKERILFLWTLIL